MESEKQLSLLVLTLMNGSMIITVQQCDFYVDELVDCMGDYIECVFYQKCVVNIFPRIFTFMRQMKQSRHLSSFGQRIFGELWYFLSLDVGKRSENMLMNNARYKCFTVLTPFILTFSNEIFKIKASQEKTILKSVFSLSPID